MNRRVIPILLCLIFINIIILPLPNLKAVNAWVGGPIYIRADGTIEPSTAPIFTTDYVTYKLTDDIQANTSGIFIERANIVLDGAGHNLLGTGNYESIGIYVDGEGGANNVTIVNIYVEDFRYGIYINSSSGNKISNNTLLSIVWGIYLKSSYNNMVSENILKGYTENAIELSTSTNNLIIGNNITDGWTGIVLDNSLNNSIHKNYIAENLAGGISLSKSQYNNISENDVMHCSEGIDIGYSSNNNTIINNNIGKSHRGVWLLYSSYNNISRNNIWGNEEAGVYLQDSPYNLIKNNSFIHDGVVIAGGGVTGVKEAYVQTIEGNTVNGKPLLYIVNQSALVIDGMEVGQLILINCTNLTIENLNLSDTDIGLYVYNSSYINIYRNNVSGNDIDGIVLKDSSDNNTISENNITRNLGNGLTIIYSSYNLITGNNIGGNGRGIVLWDSTNNVFSRNNLSHEFSGIEILGYFTNSSNNVVSENIVSRVYRGIYIDSSVNNRVYGNVVRLAEENGVELYSTQNDMVYGNNITGSGRGIRIFGTRNTTIHSNIITNNSMGIYIYYSLNNTVDGNLITENNYGLTIDNSSNILISGNEISNNDFDGISIKSFSEDNLIIGNNISSNGNGTVIMDSMGNKIIGNNISMSGCGINLTRSMNNIIYHNNFMDNSVHAAVVPSNYTNIWDDGYPYGGNYWSGYTDTDEYRGPYQNISGSDGIWDHPYEINGANIDHYPFVGPWPRPIFQLSSLAINPDTVYVGEEVIITANVTNVGGLAGSYKVILLINASPVDTKELTLSPGESQIVEFITSRDEPGVYIIGVDGLTGILTVKPRVKPAEFIISDLSIMPQEVDVGEEVTITVAVKNIGELSGTCTIRLFINGTLVDTKDVTLAGGEVGSVSFKVVENEPGAYSVDVDGQTGGFIVKQPPGIPWIYVIAVVVVVIVAVSVIFLRGRG